MKRRKFDLLAMGVVVFCLAMADRVMGQWSYPATKTVDSSNTYFGVVIKDPYRWMENMKDTSVLGWFKAEGQQTEGVLNKIAMRDSLVKELMALDKMTPVRRFNFKMFHDRYFYMAQKPEEKVGKLYYRDGKKGDDILLFDPASYPGQAGKTYSISYYVPNYQGDKVAVGVSQGGAEVAAIRIYDLSSKKWYGETIYPSWFGVTDWTADGKSFFYTLQKTDDASAPDFILDTKSRMHVVGTDTAKDVTLLSREKYPGLGIEPRDLLFVNFSEDQRYIFAGLAGVRSELNVFYAPASELTNAKINWKRLLSPADEVTGYLNYGDKLFLLSHKGAPKYQVLVTDMKQLDVSQARPLKAEGKLTIGTFTRSKNFMFLTLSDGINSWLSQYDLRTGVFKDIQLPQVANSTLNSYNYESDEVLIEASSWNLPTFHFDYNAEGGDLKKSAFQVDVNYPGLEKLKVKEVEVPSYDGTMVPLSIVYQEGMRLDGNNSCMMDGYGAYGISGTPQFSILYLAMAKRGVVMAYAHVRGGGEKGESWYRGGFKTTKPNTWKDFNACGEWLIQQGYTSPKKLAGSGTSAGGILIGRAITERPDLYAAAICNVGCANALRMETTPNGPNNTLEFGVSTDSVECKALIEMDAFLHVKEGVKYPAVLCATGINDPRVPPWQPGKFAAALQHASTSGKPVLLRVDYDNGHFTADKTVAFKDAADQFSFVLWQTGHPDFQ
jgi:prolyl oligopeptidase